MFVAVAVLSLICGAWMWEHNRNLSRWTEAADAGKIVIAVRVHRAGWHALHEAERVIRVLPESQNGDAMSGHFQRWRESGWRRIERSASSFVNPQDLADRCLVAIENHFTAHGIDANYELRVIDEAGTVYVPKGD